MPKTLIAAGHIPAKKPRRAGVHSPHACRYGCVGPFVRRPDLDAWMLELAEYTGSVVPLLPQYDCKECGTSRGYTPRELRRATR